MGATHDEAPGLELCTRRPSSPAGLADQRGWVLGGDPERDGGPEPSGVRGLRAEDRPPGSGSNVDGLPAAAATLGHRNHLPSVLVVQGEPTRT